MMFEAFYRVVRELQSSKMKCMRQNAQSAGGSISETVDLRGLPHYQHRLQSPRNPLRQTLSTLESGRVSGIGRVSHWSATGRVSVGRVSGRERPLSTTTYFIRGFRKIS